MGTLSGVMSRASTDGGGRSEVTDADLVLFMEALVDTGDVGNVVDEEEEIGHSRVVICPLPLLLGVHRWLWVVLWVCVSVQTTMHVHRRNRSARGEIIIDLGTIIGFGCLDERLVLLLVVRSITTVHRIPTLRGLRDSG